MTRLTQQQIAANELAAQQDAERVAAQQDAERVAAQQDAERVAAQQDAERVAAQQAELARLRAVKEAERIDALVAERVAAALAKPAATPAEHVEAVQPDPIAADIAALIGDLGVLPSARRVLVGAILGIAAAGATGYGIGCILAYALAGIMTLTATAWVAFVLSALAWIVAIYAGWKLGGYVGGKVFSSVVMPDGLAARSYESLANAAGNAKVGVAGWFSSSKEKAVQQFSGAHTVVKQAIAGESIAPRAAA